MSSSKSTSSYDDSELDGSDDDDDDNNGVLEVVKALSRAEESQKQNNNKNEGTSKNNGNNNTSSSVAEDSIIAFISICQTSRFHASCHLQRRKGDVMNALNDHFAGNHCPSKEEEEQNKDAAPKNINNTSTLITNIENEDGSFKESSIHRKSSATHNRNSSSQQQQEKDQQQKHLVTISSDDESDDPQLLLQNNDTFKQVMMSLVELPASSSPSEKSKKNTNFFSLADLKIDEKLRGSSLGRDDDDDVCLVGLSSQEAKKSNNKKNGEIDDEVEFLSVGTDFQLSQNQIMQIMKSRQQEKQQSQFLSQGNNNNMMMMMMPNHSNKNLPLRRSRENDNNNNNCSILQKFSSQGSSYSATNIPNNLLLTIVSDDDDDDFRDEIVPSGNKNGNVRSSTHGNHSAANSHRPSQNTTNNNHSNNNNSAKYTSPSLEREREELKQERMRLDLLMAQNMAKEAELDALRRQLESQRAELDSRSLAVELQKNDLDQELAPPKHWTAIRFLGNQAPAMVPIAKGSDLFDKIQTTLMNRFGAHQNDDQDPFEIENNNNNNNVLLEKDLDTNTQRMAGTLVVEKLHRIENPVLWKLYSARRGAVNSQIGGHKRRRPIPGFNWAHRELGLQSNVNEMLLFHGTKPSAYKQIAGGGVAAQGGFDCRLGRDIGNYGSSVYTADRADKSDAYTAPDEHGLHYMFLCRVTLGTSYEMDPGEFYTQQRRPPCRNGCEVKVKRPGFNNNNNNNLGWGGALINNIRRRNQNNAEGEISQAVREGRPCDEHLPSDSVIGRVTAGAPREYMVYESNQIYPEFLVVYRRQTAQGAPW